MSKILTGLTPFRTNSLFTSEPRTALGMSASKENNDRNTNRKPSNPREKNGEECGQDVEKVESEQCAKYLKALADPARIRILKALQGGALTGTDLSNLLDIEIPNVSHHLRVLYHAGIVNTRRDGRFIYYEIDREVIAEASVSQTLNFGCCSLKMS